MHCYEQFGWRPDDLRRLPTHEAELLSIYFEELAAARAEEQKKLEDRPGHDRPAHTNVGGEFTTDTVIGGDDDDEEDEDDE